MVATQKLYPRGTVKRIVKAHAGRSISKNADVLVSQLRKICRQDRIIVISNKLTLSIRYF